jgi:hypothetical protein
VTAVGPPGIGKSRLARELSVVLGDDAHVVVGRCLPYGEDITYGPLIEIFRELGSEKELEHALAAGGSEEIFWSVRKALERRGREQPLALVVEDIHWAEPTMLDLIEHLRAWTRGAPVLLVCLARPELLSTRPAWGGELLRLDVLSAAECDQLIDLLVEGVEVGAATRDRIREVADGNPLFVEQLLAMLTGGGDPDEVPGTIRALLAARLDALPEDERDVLERASVVGLEFEWQALAELAPGRARPSGALLASLVRKEFVRLHETHADTFRFAHALLRDAAYERIPKAVRSELHERFAFWLEAGGEEVDEIVGYHLEQAHRCLLELGPEGTRAMELARRAGSRLAASGLRAYTRGDGPAAAGLLARAASLYSLNDPYRLGLLPTLGRALIQRGETPRAHSVLSEAAERARGTGQKAVEMDARVELSLLRLITNPQQTIGQGEVKTELEAAIPFFEVSGDHAALARALGVSGSLRFWRGEAAAAIRDFERAAQLAGEAEERSQEVESLEGVLTALVYGPTPVTEALARVQGMEVAASRNSQLQIHVLRVAGRLYAAQGSFGVARECISQARELADRLGLEAPQAMIAAQAGAIELLAGEPGEAERELRSAYAALERIGHWGYITSVVPHLVDALLSQRHDGDGLRLTDVAAANSIPEDIDAQVGWRRARAKLLARRGDLIEAEQLGRVAMTMVERTDFLELRAQVRLDLAEVLDLGRRSDESAVLRNEALGLFEQKENLAAARPLRDRLAIR